MSNEERLRKLLSDLGKATLRGVRKCPKCGTYNGSRGLCCKNKLCATVFNKPGEKRKLSTEACKLITGSTVQVFSVRVRDKGPDYRGFVQLPLINATISNDITTFMSQTTALCFVDSCERSFDTSVLKCHEKNYSDMSISTCQHIQAALRCYSEAQPLTLKNSILSSFNMNNETKQEIWLLATETSGPMVQRVSKNIMAVKCKASPKHPLGYLHFSFFVTKMKDRIEHRYFCSCTTFKSTVKGTVVEDKVDSTSSLQPKRCVHFYACVCAFASDTKLSEEFSYYINLDQTQSTIPKPVMTMAHNDKDKIIGIDLDSLTTDDTDTHLLIFRDDTLTVQSLDGNRLDLDSMNLDSSILSHGIVENIEVECDHNLLDDNNIISQVHNLEVIDQNSVQLDGNTIKILDDQATIDTKYNILNNSQYILNDNNIKILDASTLKVLDTNAMLSMNTKVVDNSTVLNNGIKIIDKNEISATTQPVVSSKRKRDEKSTSVNNLSLNSIEPRKTKTKSQIIKKYQNACHDDLDEANTNLPFIKWLASITERINQTMHFQFDGKPDPLVFHVPQIFFDCLRERISCGGKKKRLPNSTTAFVRKDGVPLGTFTKYTWQITNILHVKSIFETSYIPLEITRSFVQNADGTYELYKREETEIDRYKKTNNNALIKPLELKTYLKVGNTSPNQVDPTPFLIEWIPDILPISKIGELRIRFEFGHVKNETNHKWRKIALSKNY
ncbi:uncharacterized protein C2orf42 homolog [Harpegnathos saltator]|uniref:Uncharacterized protein C2orf42 n=1 Tax=Harpegnathos saltator TaxID=610380 RepID=E2BBG8_HARSA|nr:uncharacterized protein C2orf42 homolog [Harpegnathos saltator]XP_011135688.1 uncharacterized protein C2orf42 homolog [Harpegnathos saltator]XP_011135689.1 uncharacterized protein C2orf42 homolog [Harpegnathos saltator]XP_011135691.1 uncharacterized protein C2orf42 homolog [Harpegnathos saltator]XP_011135692.1 uncharacterized protein C2orf42 homolog [Harpegnathos saltator]XP_011135693.1 uncharacterized protein C2orf42 homolog [Harpegnathos saltator]EFN86962.1 Uncharacterized protein C2orf4